MKNRWAAPLLAVLVNLNALPVAAADFSWSGFGTLGYARSDKSYTYQRFIDDNGTFKRDSVVGVQGDAKFTNEFGATVQVKAAPATASDSQYEASISWAFLSYRPTNDWLFRAGKQRIPLYLYSENYDVGATYDFARLPIEMYSITPSNDVTAFSFSRTWRAAKGEFSLDGIWGKSRNDFRVWRRDDIASVQSSGASFIGLDFRGAGLVLTYKGENQTFRIGLHRAVVLRSDGQAFSSGYPFVALAPGIGYYQVADSLPGPGVPTAPSVTNKTLVVGTELGLPADFRLVAEFARSVVPHSDGAPQGNRGYASLLKRFGKWTPYLTYAFLRSPARQRDLYNKVNYNTLPGFIPGAAHINASQRAGADSISVFDQSSWALGTSYSFSATSKFKAEYTRTRIGDVSKLVDAPPGSDIRNQSINVYSLSYNVVF